MIALLRSARFIYADGSSQFVEVRRLHDQHDMNGLTNKAFAFSRRLPRAHMTFTRNFYTLREAFRYWDEQVLILTDQGLERRDSRIMGWHEEG